VPIFSRVALDGGGEAVLIDAQHHAVLGAIQSSTKACIAGVLRR
jgi:hypothetical protein